MMITILVAVFNYATFGEIIYNVQDNFAQSGENHKC